LAVYSQPPGAYLTEVGTGNVVGMAPAAVYYDGHLLPNYKDAQGCYIVKGFEAHWISGARTVFNPVRLCGSSTGRYNITLNRDASYPDLEKDLHFALQLQALRAQQQQARAVQDAADAALISAFFSTQQNTTSVNCSSYLIGNTVQTTCR